MKCSFDLTWSSPITKNKNIDDIVCYRSDMVLDASCNQGMPNSSGITLHPVCTVSDLTLRQPCILTVEASRLANMVIDAVDIICNARHIEIFSPTGEYISISEGTKVDEELGCQQTVYMVPCSFQPSVSRCQFQFVSMEMPTELWIHSIHVTISRCTDVHSRVMLHGFGGLSGSKIDMNKVKSIMADMNVQDLHPQAKDLMDRMAMKQMELETVAASASREIPSPFASALMSMLANMAVDTTSPVVRVTQSKDHEPREKHHGQNSDEVCVSGAAMLSSSSVAPDADTDVDVGHATFNPSDASDSWGSCGSVQPQCTACGRDESAGLEQRLSQLVAATERRLTSRFIAEVSRIETKIDRRFDEILRRLNGPEAVSCDLD